MSEAQGAGASRTPVHRPQPERDGKQIYFIDWSTLEKDTTEEKEGGEKMTT